MTTKVYLLYHSRDLGDGETDDKLVGVYSSAEMAEAAKDRKLQYPGFRDLPDGFLIDSYTVDRDQWSEGFTLPDDLPSWLEVLPDGSLRAAKRGQKKDGAAATASTRPVLKIVSKGAKKDGAPGE